MGRSIQKTIVPENKTIAVERFYYMKNIGIVLIFTAVFGLFSGCADKENNSFNSTLWVQSSAEYKANCIQTYRVAGRNIDGALNDKGWTAAIEQDNDFSALPPAVVMDIDETVLDNSQYQAKLVIDRTEWNSGSWDKWVALKSASAVPGAADFIKAMKEKNIEVIYITNRECRPRQTSNCQCPQEQDTVDNLARVGIKGVKPEHILMQNEQPDWSSDKKTRREAIAEKYRILMIVGDDLGDFLPDVKKNITPRQREELLFQYGDDWGMKWYALPNPTYGSWLRVLEEPKSKYLVDF